MLAIRMQRTGRKGHAMFRMVVQDSRRTPTSGKVVARLGSYDPHAKTLSIDKDKANFYLEHGAQPSDRVAYLLKQEGVKLPDWVKLSAERKRSVRNADKRRSTRPDEPEAPAEPAAEAPAAEEAAEAPEAPAENGAAEQAAATAEPETSQPSEEAAPSAETAEAETTENSDDSATDNAAENGEEASK